MRACIALLLMFLGGCSLDTVSQGLASDHPPSLRKWSAAERRYDAPLHPRPVSIAPRAGDDLDVDAGSPEPAEPTLDARSHRADAGRPSQDTPGERDGGGVKPARNSSAPVSTTVDGGAAEAASTPDSGPQAPSEPIIDGGPKDTSTDSEPPHDAGEADEDPDEPSDDGDDGDGMRRHEHEGEWQDGEDWAESDDSDGEWNDEEEDRGRGKNNGRRRKDRDRDRGEG